MILLFLDTDFYRNNVRAHQYPINLLCDVFELRSHEQNYSNNTFKTIVKYGTEDKLNVVMGYLSDIQKTCVRLYYHDLLSIKEIAQKLDRSEKRIIWFITMGVNNLGINSYRKRMLIEGTHVITHIEQLDVSDDIKQILMEEGIVNPFVLKNISRKDLEKLPNMDSEKIAELLNALDIILIFGFYGEEDHKYMYYHYAPRSSRYDYRDILCLDIDTESRRLLRLAGVDTIKKLVDRHEAWIRRIPGISNECVDSIYRWLSCNNIPLRTNVTDDDHSNPLESISVLGLSTRVCNILIKNNINTIGQLSSTNYWDVRDIDGIGYNCAKVIYDKLDSYMSNFIKEN